MNLATYVIARQMPDALLGKNFFKSDIDLWLWLLKRENCWNKYGSGDISIWLTLTILDLAKRNK